MKRSKNQRGFSHHFILPLLVFIAVGAIGAYVITKSNAATAGPSDVVYSTHLEGSGDKYYRYDSANGVSTEYPSSVSSILDVSKDQKWVLAYDNSFNVFALSASGEKFSYGDLKNYNDSSYDGYSCSSNAVVTKDFHFSKANQSTSNPPKLYFIEGAIPCENGKYAAVSKNPLYVTLRSVGVNGTNKTTITKFTNYSSRFGVAVSLNSVSTNGNFAIWKGPADNRAYILSAKGATIFKGQESAMVYLSENGKRIAYMNSSFRDIYVANSNGKSSKKLLSSNKIALTGISPAGTYVLYQKAVSKDYTKASLYSLKVSSKKSYKIDTATNWQSGLPGAINNEHWLPGSTTIVYYKHDAVKNTAQLIQSSITGSAKKTIVSVPYSKNNWVNIY